LSVVVIGRNGQVARGVRRAAANTGRRITILARPEFDLMRPGEVAAELKRLRPEIIVNAAAYTAVDRAEADGEDAFAVNATGAGAVAEAAASVDAALVHISTDYVFSGRKETPYVESDVCDPINVYGKSKLEGERLVHAAHPRAIVVRTSWVYDSDGTNFVRTMLRLARTRGTVNVVNDQFGRPTFAPDVAEAALMLGSRAAQGAAVANIVHCAGGEVTSWAAFAREIFALSHARGGPVADVIEIPAKEYQMAAQRPLNSRLDCSLVAREYGIELRSWREALTVCIDEIAAAGWSVE
jgi:dTDP-4-dehydrorhamnose reductase